MATKKDLDDILNNNAKVKKSSAKKANTKKRAKNDADNMSVDDVLNSLDNKKSDTPKKLAPLPPKKSTVKPAPTENKTKKRIVISGELPDYDTLRNQELEKEKQKKAKEEAEKKRLEAEKKAKEEAERKRLEAEKKAKEEAERKRLEAEKKAKEEAEKKRLEAEKKAKEEAERKRLEAEKKAKEEAEKKRLEAEKKAKEEAERKRLEAEKKAKEEAEKKRLEEETKRRMLEEAEEFTVEEITEISTSEKYDDDDYEEIEIFEETDNSDPVGSLIDNIREDAEKAFADIENSGNDEKDEELTEENPPDEEDEDDEEKPSGITATLENILDEDPDEIINARREKPEADKKKKPKLRLKKNIYTFLGLVFAVLACVGLVTIVSKGISLISGFSSGNSKKTGFEPVVYPAVIMDIESFETPAELPSEQIITAAIWSMIMSDDAISNYEQTFDVVKIPAVDVELYAVKMFGENLPTLNHTTVGPAESRFYYNEETKSYNVPIAPVTYTYSPEIKGATKNDNTYTIVVDYIDELPEWLPKKSSKSVEFKLTETNDGYIINSMKVLSTSSNAL